MIAQLPGLSPLARGTLLRHFPVVERSRFIPAGAGNTISSIQEIICQAVYPRWRGEHYDFNFGMGMANGLSPLARGTRHFRFSDHAANRFIPAGAGNTRRLASMWSWTAVYPRWRGEHWYCAP
ncbi:hypothetical protein SEEBA664_15513 [Salmonella enterica subsp. enterica serovar Braenderup str. ATCC BAA-664]|nr:hypothetical protein SEEBA664_15513 [Salmonella enterica subsp. enterica serovar Braenderup str. ATCC BAA-664]QDX90373.1 CRISPR associated protein of unknown function [Salmonella enterica subsp. enterica serovar Braenderup]